jgi:hypothetical protein
MEFAEPRRLLVVAAIACVIGLGMLATGLGWFHVDPEAMTTAAVSGSAPDDTSPSTSGDTAWMRPLTVAGGIIAAAGVGLLMLAFSRIGRADRR